MVHCAEEMSGHVIGVLSHSPELQYGTISMQEQVCAEDRH